MQGKNKILRTVSVIIAVIMMGFALSWLVIVDMGTDPCTALNMAIASKIGMSIGNWQAIFNSLLIIIVLLCSRKYIGVGTVANMFLVGYSLDFFLRFWKLVLPSGIMESFFIRLPIMAAALLVFVISAAVYMDVQLGTAPYDAVAFILSDKLPKVPIRILRIIYDMAVIGLSYILGGTAGPVTFLIAFTLGPAIEYVGKRLNKYL